MELYRKYRPTEFEDVKGQWEAVGMLKGWLQQGNVPHAILLKGASGVGKTTLARILANKLGAVTEFDYQEVNVAEERGVGMVAELGEDMSHNISNNNRVWVLDEVQGMLKASQNSLLKKLEDAPSYAYFVLCTTNPEKLLPTLLTRCSQIVMHPMSSKALQQTLERVIQLEHREISSKVLDAIIKTSNYSARAALVKLEQCFATTREESMLQLIESVDDFSATIKDLCCIFTSGRRTSWENTVRLFTTLTEDPETIRRSVFGWLGSALEKGWAKQVPLPLLAQLMDMFTSPIYDMGRPQLLLQIYKAWVLSSSQ